MRIKGASYFWIAHVSLNVREACVEFDLELLRLAGYAEIGEAVGVGVEAVAVVVDRIEYEREVGRVARLIHERARDEHGVQVAHALDLRGTQVGARRVERVRLQREYVVRVVGDVGRHEQRRGVVSRQRIVGAYGDGGKERALLDDETRGGGDLIGGIRLYRAHDEHGARTRRHGQHEAPHHAQAQVWRAQHIGHAVDAQRVQMGHEHANEHLAAQRRRRRRRRAGRRRRRRQIVSCLYHSFIYFRVFLLFLVNSPCLNITNYI